MMLLVFLFFLFFISKVKSECLNGRIPTFTNPKLCYFFQTNETYYLEAEEECRKLGGHLTSVHNMLDNMFLTQEALLTFTDSANSDFWFGLSDLAVTGNWSWMDNSTVDFADWDKGQPQNISGSDCGAVVKESAKWISEDCFKKKPFVCLMPEATTPPPTTTSKPKVCPESWVYFDETGFCYRALKNETWLNSGERCKNDGAELASIHLLTEASFVANFSRITFGEIENVWIGLFTDDDGAHWQWTDGTPFDLPNWAPNNPDNLGSENCVAMYPTGKLNNWRCYESTAFVCKKLLS